MEALTFNTTEQALLAAVGILFLIQLLYHLTRKNQPLFPTSALR